MRVACGDALRPRIPSRLSTDWWRLSQVLSQVVASRAFRFILVRFWAVGGG